MSACGFWAPAISQSCQMRTESTAPPRLCQHPEPIPWLVGARAGHQMSLQAHTYAGTVILRPTAACREPAPGLPAQPTDTRLSSADRRRRCWVRRCREARRRRCHTHHDGLVWGVAGLRDSRVGAVGRACVGRVWVGPATPRTPALRHQTTHQGHSCGGGIIGATEQPVSRL